MELRAARRSERDEVLDLLALWYNDREFFVRYNQLDRKFRDELCLVARDGGALVCTVQIFDRAVNLDGHRVPMGGIGSVFTRDDYRHKGVASALMRLAVETMEREKFEISLLFAERLTFYNQFGWREVPRKFSVLMNAAGMHTQGEYEIDVFDSSRDLMNAVEVHRGYTGRLNVATVRNIDDWHGNLAYAGNQPIEGCWEYFILARDAGAIGAYARITRFHGVTMVMEYGYRPGAENGLLALFHHLGEVTTGARCTHRLRGDHSRAKAMMEGSGAAAPAGVLITHTAHDKALEERLVKSGCSLSYHEDNNYMWRIISSERLAKRLSVSPAEASTRAFDIFANDASLFWTSDRF